MAKMLYQDARILKKEVQMIKKLLIITLLFIAPSVFADTGYVSPENYAVNEADLTDYWSVPKSEPLNITSETKPAKIKYKKEKPEKYKKPYEERLMYKVAKWWTDQRYKREEPHHGEKHEIKVNSTYRQEQMKKLQSSESKIETDNTSVKNNKKQKKNKKSKKNKKNN